MEKVLVAKRIAYEKDSREKYDPLRKLITFIMIIKR